MWFSSVKYGPMIPCLKIAYLTFNFALSKRISWISSGLSDPINRFMYWFTWLDKWKCASCENNTPLRNWGILYCKVRILEQYSTPLQLSRGCSCWYTWITCENAFSSFRILCKQFLLHQVQRCPLLADFRIF